MDRRLTDFVGFATAHMIEHGVSVRFENQNQLEGGGSGCFGHPECDTAVDRKDWVSIFVHEYCHFLQHLDEEAGVELSFPSMTDEQYARFWGGFKYPKPEEPVRVPDSEFRCLARNMQLMEAENDARAIVIIQEWDLPIDVPDYIRTANAYHLLYEYIAKHRRWPDVSIYSIPKIVAAMPPILAVPGSWKMTPQLEVTISLNCFNPRRIKVAQVGSLLPKTLVVPPAGSELPSKPCRAHGTHTLPESGTETIPGYDTDGGRNTVQSW